MWVVCAGGQGNGLICGLINYLFYRICSGSSTNQIYERYDLRYVYAIGCINFNTIIKGYNYRS
jgi:hypothetical protein